MESTTQHSQERQITRKGSALKSHQEGDQLAKGDLVLLRRLKQDNQRSPKLEPRWEGPYRISAVTNYSAAHLSELNGSKKGRYHRNAVERVVAQERNTLVTPRWEAIVEDKIEVGRPMEQNKAIIR